MSDTNIEVSLPLDSDGFLSRECPYCKMRFKLHQGDFDGEKLPEKMFCPYCGQSATKDEFWTIEQIKYFQDIAMFKVVAPALDELENSLTGLDMNSGLFGLKVSIDKGKTNMPVAPEEMDDMSLHKQTCCAIEIKIDKTWVKGLHCIMCGEKDG
jgi:hypothetical protein